MIIVSGCLTLTAVNLIILIRMAYTAARLVQDLLCHLTSAYMKCVYGWAGVRYVITKFSLIDSLPNFFTHDAPQRALRARESSAMKEPHAHVVTSLFALNKCRVAELRHKLSKQ